MTLFGYKLVKANEAQHHVQNLQVMASAAQRFVEQDKQFAAQQQLVWLKLQLANLASTLH